MTPVLEVAGRTMPAGQPLLLKAENLQRSGSFKIRGASYCIAQLSREQRERGVIAYSTGNHAQAVALAAGQRGISATIVMSADAPAFKVERTRQYGAHVVWSEPTSQARRELAEQLAREQQLALIPPYDQREILVGQGTIGLEIIEQSSPSAVFVPIGGGGLISGIALSIKLSNSSTRVIGVEPEWENDAWQSFARGELVALPAASQSIADAIRVQVLGDLPYAVVRRYVDEIVTVSESQIASATLDALNEMHLVLEPAGAVALAAAREYQGALPAGRPVVALASGGNTTLAALCSLASAFPGV
ncbi:MAG TPA: threonine/serine dehydratase [Ktedonobacteraceae bacterium]